MPLYEHVFIARQDISGAQAEGLIEEFSNVISTKGGTVVGDEYWGLRTMAYKINKNRKGHYAMLRIDAPAEAVQEMERLQRIHDDVLRSLSVRVDEHEDGPSVILQAKSARADRDERRNRRRDDEAPAETKKEAESKPEPKTENSASTEAASAE